MYFLRIESVIETLPALDAAFLIIISLVVLSAILFHRGYANAAPIYASIAKQRRHSFSLKQHHKVPCHRCRYFSRNPYLKCALHPVIVLTEQAVDCTDYCPNSEAKRVEKWRKALLIVQNVFPK
ncbi:hypothetical protein H6G81_14590 [Scytonema hofmannii FACHB-248]|uniref:Uncharacterized protein n=1 Tax=Scytonema hofmannii FACHB-248 TaxID=1842502 RepID=A0ABR8GRQ8_9CYAN|nr:MULTISPECIES: hypothetical protein [Nostocales]MBD2605720.1 hypothetical protein [Scytonema hofmannii FACHB-248]